MTGPGKAGPSAFDLIWAPQERGSSRHQGHGGDSSDLAPVQQQLIARCCGLDSRAAWWQFSH